MLFHIISEVHQRSNITFGQTFDEERYWKVIEDACLLPDLQLLADGDLTEVRLSLWYTMVNA
jgi:hypothetical protein